MRCALGGSLHAARSPTPLYRSTKEECNETFMKLTALLNDKTAKAYFIEKKKGLEMCGFCLAFAARFGCLAPPRPRPPRATN